MVMGMMYSLAALAMLVAGVLLLIRRGQSEAARNAAVAAIVSAAWAALMFSQAPAGAWPTWNAMMADGFRLGAWLMALQALASVELPRVVAAHEPRVVRGTHHLHLRWRHLANHGRRPADAHRRGRPGSSLRWRRSSRPCTCGVRRCTTQSSKVRWCAATIAGQFAIDALTYAQAAVAGERRSFALGAASRGSRRRDDSADAQRLAAADRRAAACSFRGTSMFYASSFVFLAFYFILTAVGGLLRARSSGATAANLLQTLVIAAAALVLIVFLLAEWPMRRLRVFISHALLPQQVRLPHRVAAIRPDAVERRRAGRAPQRASARSAQIFGSPAACSWFATRTRRRFYLRRPGRRSSDGFPTGDRRSRRTTTCRSFSRGRQWVVDLREYAAHPERTADMELPRWLDRAVPGASIVAAAGRQSAARVS